MASCDSIRKAFMEVAICSDSLEAALILQGPESPGWLVISTIHDHMEVCLERLDSVLSEAGIVEGAGAVGPVRRDEAEVSVLRSVGGSH